MSNRLFVIIEAVDRWTKPIRKLNQDLRRVARVEQLTGAYKNIAARFSAVTREVRRLRNGLLALGLTGGAVTFLFKRQLIDTGAQFERFRTILETVEGSSAKASQSMDWVSDFATRTPFELDEVLGSFVKLRAYGLDPTNGLLRTLGDTAAAMGKPLNQAVEAIADAVTGENERLKEFGIKARVTGKRIVYEYTSNGKTIRKAAQAGNREQIQSTLEAIWNEKYAGAMEKQSKTWIGMMSNISDQWTRFKVLIMNSGVFEWLKTKLAMILERINAMAASGELQRLAADIGQRLVTALKAAWQAGRVFWQVLQAIGSTVRWVADLVGGFGNLGLILAGIIGGKLIFALVGLAGSLKVIAALLMANPLILAVTLLATAAALIIKNWAPIKDFFVDLWDGIVRTFKAAIIKLDELLPDWLQNLTGVGRSLGSAAARFRAETVTPGTNRTEVGGKLQIELLNGQGARVRRIEQDNPAFGFDVDTGPSMVWP